MHIIGKIDLDLYRNITDKQILTDEVIITDNRISHIIERRGINFYNEYQSKFREIIENPDYIFKDDDMPNTAIVSKRYTTNGKTINIVLRIVVEGDDPSYRNSIITAIGENTKRFEQRLRNNKPIYIRVDKKE